VSDSVATFEAMGVDPEGAEFPVIVRIGRPYLAHEDPGVWRCPLSVEPLHSRLPDVAGSDSFQAICLASRLAVELLRGFVDKGGRLVVPDGDDVPLDTYIQLVRAV
jgi:hypothetical protein